MRRGKKMEIPKRTVKVMTQTAPVTEFADWMDQDDIGEDLRGWTPTGWVEPKVETQFEMMGEDRPGMTQSEKRFFDQEKEHLPPNED